MKGYFQFTRRQKIGVVSLLAIIIFLVVLLNVNNHRGLPDPTDVDLSKISFTSVQEDSNSFKNSSFDENEHVEDLSNSNRAYQLFNFDPNILNVSGWEKLGFSEKQSSSIVSYRENYGPFKSPEDVGKIYVISEDKFEEIKPYMQFDDELSVEGSEAPIIEINIATPEQLETIHGIGPTFAKRTIKYREILGGYSTKSQFENIFGITEDALKALKENVQIDQSAIRKIAVNSASKDEMKKHPYLKDWSVTTEIIVQREKEMLKDLNFLLEKDLMTAEELDKLLPYISFK